MNNDYTIGFKFKDKDYTATVSAYSTSAFTFYRVNLNEENLIGEFGQYLSFAQDALHPDTIKCVKQLPTELENCIVNELHFMS